MAKYTTSEKMVSQEPTPSSPAPEQLELNTTIQSIQGLTNTELSEAVAKNSASARQMIRHLSSISEKLTEDRDAWKAKYKSLLKIHNTLKDEHNKLKDEQKDLLDLNAHLLGPELNLYHAPRYPTYDSEDEDEDENECQREFEELENEEMISGPSSVESTPKSSDSSNSSSESSVLTPKHNRSSKSDSSTSSPEHNPVPKTILKRKSSIFSSSQSSTNLDSKLVATSTNKALKPKPNSKLASKSADDSTSPPNLKTTGKPQSQAKVIDKHHCQLTMEELLTIRPNPTESMKKRYGAPKFREAPRFQVTHAEYLAIMARRESMGTKGKKTGKKGPKGKWAGEVMDMNAVDNGEIEGGDDGSESQDEGEKKGTKKRKLSKK